MGQLEAVHSENDHCGVVCVKPTAARCDREGPELGIEEFGWMGKAAALALGAPHTLHSEGWAREGYGIM